MDERINKIIDRLLDDCLRSPNDSGFGYPDLSEKDLLNLTQIFLEFKYPKQTRTSIKDTDDKAPTLDY